MNPFRYSRLRRMCSGISAAYTHDRLRSLDAARDRLVMGDCYARCVPPSAFSAVTIFSDPPVNSSSVNVRSLDWNTTRSSSE